MGRMADVGLRHSQGYRGESLAGNIHMALLVISVELAKRATVVSDIERIKTLGTIKAMIGFGKTCPGPGYP
ncbi:hypothetical protein FOVSG1_011976 [Fusarium oxysporum f. sp. vasinfectum]